MRQRANRRKVRQQAAVAAGVDDADINSDTSEDSAYESGREGRTRVQKQSGNMPPPPKPSGASEKRKAPNAGRRKQEPKHPKLSTNNRSLQSSRQTPSQLVMSGGLGSGRTSKSRHSTVSGSSVDDDEEDGNTSEDYDARHPTVPPEDSLRQRLSATRSQRAKSRSAPNEGITPFKDWVNGAAANGDQDQEERRNGSPDGEGNGGDGDADRRREEVNGGMDDDEAFHAAMRASQVPEDRNGEGATGEHATGNEGLPDGPADVRPSTEVEKEESEGKE
ncbi:hypothetical protein LTR36_000076 [Oleoguttula mirabilis]|uniref:Uncharacterized protein n=1 Tax=Oleoguttula mirabilis TaxID=1507867 RepID=A0AAV9JXS6_9PEZI|nr:hypothetical protein LTR36_000076 [Oleoguttula mirabilis]